MKKSAHTPLKAFLRATSPLTSRFSNQRPFICRQCLSHQKRYASAPADQPGFVSIVDTPARIVRAGVIIPVTAFALGTWQVQRLDWKTKLIAKFEDRLIKPPLPLPPRIDPSAVKDFDYRRVYATGHFRHDKEMLIGPRMHDGTDGFLVVTPLERDTHESTILVNRGWISKAKKYQRDRKDPEALPQGEVTVEGLLREPWKKNMFTPENKPLEGKFYFPDVEEMAEVSGSQPVWIESTMEPDLITAMDREAKGVPIGRAAEVNLRNNHTQYIFTWYSLSLATTIMLWMVVKKKPSQISRRVRESKEW